jgi:hypothetical protein
MERTTLERVARAAPGTRETNRAPTQEEGDATTAREWIDNSELIEAAGLLEAYAEALEDEGDKDEAGAQRDSAATFRHLARKASLEGGCTVHIQATIQVPEQEEW